MCSVYYTVPFRAGRKNALVSFRLALFKPHSLFFFLFFFFPNVVFLCSILWTCVAAFSVRKTQVYNSSVCAMAWQWLWPCYIVLYPPHPGVKMLIWQREKRKKKLEGAKMFLFVPLQCVGGLWDTQWKVNWVQPPHHPGPTSPPPSIPFLPVCCGLSFYVSMSLPFSPPVIHVFA